ncbi:peptide chain release factor N(5)-glutamine methyltransferase [Sporolactobacillus shoreae]|uniref:Release factor glutamine methyltransferase n=1 Tax=Sporolactobacillus shoreae TaxID=1465501 RepID=A0A4Z0GTV7_9BACL|nr:peptide chain release factor N(5)-glutamine methyltransferase [Sporolactobacillus shoreae]TGA99742.1 peptide chain release factor N(5)-glutamine methyltransferase [Sporolactobacillus shoreae]
MTLKRFEALRWASSFLKEHHRDENIGEILLENRLHLSRTDMLIENRELLTPEDEEWLKQRVTEHAIKGTPVQYMIGEAPFYGRTFKVTSDVLIPRQDTEELVYRCEKWTERYFPAGKNLSVCDIGTGSGAIAITLALEHPEWDVTAVDLSHRALAIARENASDLGAKVTFKQGDLLEPLKNEAFDLLVSNPPYISRPEMDELGDTVKNYEPHLALFGGDDGLDFYRKIIRELPAVLGPIRMIIAFEIGAGQGNAVSGLIRSAFPDQIESLSVEQDMAGLDRNVMAVLRKK